MLRKGVSLDAEDTGIEDPDTEGPGTVGEVGLIGALSLYIPTIQGQV